MKDRFRDALMGVFILAVVFAFMLIAVSPAYGQSVLPLTEKDGLLRVSAQINGRSGSFVLDTGASITIVTPEASGLSGPDIIHLDSVAVEGFVVPGGMPVAPLHMVFGNIALTARVGVVKIPNLHADGVIGNDLLRKFKRVEIDYRQKTITLWE